MEQSECFWTDHTSYLPIKSSFTPVLYLQLIEQDKDVQECIIIFLSASLPYLAIIPMCLKSTVLNVTSNFWGG